MKTMAMWIVACVMGAFGTATLAQAPPAQPPAAETPASEASVRELFNLMNTRAMFENIGAQFSTSFKAGIQQAVAGRTLTPQQQQALDALQSKMVVAYRDMLNWERLEPVFERVYQNSLSQDEVDGMLTFYRSKAGQAVIKKMPLIMQNMMAEMQNITGPFMKNVRQAVDEALAQGQEQQEQGPAPSSAKPPQPATPPKAN